MPATALIRTQQFSRLLGLTGTRSPPWPPTNRTRCALSSPGPASMLSSRRPLFAVDDGTFPETGMVVGLWTKTDSVNAFNYGEQRKGTPLVTPRTNWSVIDA